MKHNILLSFLFLSFIAFSQTTHFVNAGMMYFNPANLVVEQGDIVIWINDGGTHDINGDINSITNEPFNNPEIFTSQAISTVGAEIYTHTFTVPGFYNYDCSVGSHAVNGMVGTVTVNESNPIDCVDDDVTAADLASMWNPDISGCEEAVVYFESVGYPCNTDLSILGMTGTISDICECSCEELDVLGCTDPQALNYNPDATGDDGSCEYDEDCIDDNSTIEQYFSSFFITECNALINYLEMNYGYSQEEACAWNGAPMLDLNGLLISDICECSCDLESIMLNENNIIRAPLFMVDVSGKKVLAPSVNQLLFIVYDDGSVKKIILKK